jgi:hypothetical protein
MLVRTNCTSQGFSQYHIWRENIRFNEPVVQYDFLLIGTQLSIRNLEMTMDKKIVHEHINQKEKDIANSDY